MTLTAEERNVLLDLARDSVLTYLESRSLPDVPIDRPAYVEERGTFVTLRVRATGELRGCRGESVARRALVDSVANMAVASAVDDPRFDPVTLDEVDALHIEISALTPLVEIRPDEVEVGRHGLLLTHPEASGLLLPQVATDHGWGVQEYLAHTCIKAGLDETAWQHADAVLYGFEAEAWHEG